MYVHTEERYLWKRKEKTEPSTVDTMVDALDWTDLLKVCHALTKWRASPQKQIT